MFAGYTEPWGFYGLFEPIISFSGLLCLRAGLMCGNSEEWVLFVAQEMAKKGQKGVISGTERDGGGRGERRFPKRMKNSRKTVKKG